MANRYLAPTPHTSNIHGQHLHHQQRPEPTGCKLTNVILGPLTAQQHSRYKSQQSDGHLKRVQSAPCLGAHKPAEQNDHTSNDLASDQVSLQRQIVIICIALIICYVIATLFPSIYKGVAMILIPALIFVWENSCIGLVALAYLPAVNGQAALADTKVGSE
jgi:hypothetical protein